MAPSEPASSMAPSGSRVTEDAEYFVAEKALWVSGEGTFLPEQVRRGMGRNPSEGCRLADGTHDLTRASQAVQWLAGRFALFHSNENYSH
jgi:hypothetical protein